MCTGQKKRTRIISNGVSDVCGSHDRDALVFSKSHMPNTENVGLQFNNLPRRQHCVENQFHRDDCESENVLFHVTAFITRNVTSDPDNAEIVQRTHT